MTTNPITFYSLTLSPFVGGSSSLRTGANCYAVCTLGWVNLYQKLEIEKKKVVVKSLYSKKIIKKFKRKMFTQMACGFANFCKLPLSHTFKVMQSKI